MSDSESESSQQAPPSPPPLASPSNDGEPSGASGSPATSPQEKRRRMIFVSRHRPDKNTFRGLVYSRDHNRFYYVDPKTNEPTWELPERYAWMEHKHPETGEPYYHNASTDASTFEAPPLFQKEDSDDEDDGGEGGGGGGRGEPVTLSGFMGEKFRFVYGESRGPWGVFCFVARAPGECETLCLLARLFEGGNFNIVDELMENPEEDSLYEKYLPTRSFGFLIRGEDDDDVEEEGEEEEKGGGLLTRGLRMLMRARA